jgi:hypothetical protein
MYKLLSIKKSNDSKKKIQVELYNTKTKKVKNINVGSAGMDDYTLFKDDKTAEEHKERYITRHQKREDWTINGITTAGFWARWLLWNKRNINDSIKDIIKKYNL